MKEGQKVSDFRNRFSELVEASGKSQSDLAADIGVSKQTLSAWITGTNSPRLPTITALSSFFGVSIPWLHGYDVPKYIVKEPEPQPFLSSEEEFLLASYRAADARAREDAMSLLLQHPAAK